MHKHKKKIPLTFTYRFKKATITTHQVNFPQFKGEKKRDFSFSAPLRIQTQTILRSAVRDILRHLFSLNSSFGYNNLLCFNSSTDTIMKTTPYSLDIIFSLRNPRSLWPRILWTSLVVVAAKKSNFGPLVQTGGFNENMPLVSLHALAHGLILLSLYAGLVTQGAKYLTLNQFSYSDACLEQ